MSSCEKDINPMLGLSCGSRVVLLTTVRREQNGIGALFVRDVLKGAPEVDIVWQVIAPYCLSTVGTSTGVVRRVVNSVLVRTKVLQNLRIWLFIRFRIRTAVDKLEAEVSEAGACRVWVTTSSPEVICIAAELAKRGHDMRVTVWDAPEYLLQNLGVSQHLTAEICERFSILLQSAKACSVVSEEMRDVVAARFPKLCVVLMRHGISPLQIRAKKDGNAPVRIVFAGSLYSKDEWNAFVRALESANWVVAGRRIQLEFIGLFPLKGALRPAAMVHHPQMSQHDAMMHMSYADIGYLPYWLDPAKRLVARTSFPGKLTAYSAAGLAVFHHGPRWSSVSRFLSQYSFGVACDSLDPGSILDKLDQLITRMSSDEIREARSAAMEKELSDKVMVRGFRALIGSLPSKPGDSA